MNVEQLNQERNMENKIDPKTEEEWKRLGECFKCRHHNTIEKQCRVTGTSCKYPTKNCENKDYPWG